MSDKELQKLHLLEAIQMTLARLADQGGLERYPTLRRVLEEAGLDRDELRAFRAPIAFAQTAPSSKSGRPLPLSPNRLAGDPPFIGRRTERVPYAERAADSRESTDSRVAQLSDAQQLLFHVLAQNIGVWLSLTNDDLSHLVRSVFIPSTYSHGRTILRPGDPVDLLTVLAQGTVKVICAGANGRNVVLRIAGAGDVLTLPSLPNNPARAQTKALVAHLPSQIGMLTPSAVADLVAELDAARRCTLLRRCWHAAVELVLEKRVVQSLPLRDRIWHTLGQLAARFPAREQQPGTIGLPLTQNDIGALVGANRMTVNRSLNTLGKGIVSRRGKRYVVHRAPPSLSVVQSQGIPPGRRVPLQEESTTQLAERMQRFMSGMKISPRIAETFLSHARFIHCAPGAPVIVPSQDEAFAFLISGAARIECQGPDGNLTLAYAAPGWFFIHAGPSGNGATLQVTAHTESVVAVLTPDRLGHVIEAMTVSEFLALLAIGWQRLNDLAQRACLAFVMSSEERIVAALDQLAYDFPVPHPDGAAIGLPLSTKDLSDLAGVSVGSLRKCVAQLKRKQRLVIVDNPTPRFVMVGRGIGECLTA